MLRIIVFLFICICANLAICRDIYVDPIIGLQNATGSYNDPVNSIRTAVGRAADGDHILLFPGIYNNFRDVEIYDFRELHIRAVNSSDRPWVMNGALRVGDDRNPFAQPFTGSIENIIFQGTRILRISGALTSFHVNNCDFIQATTTDYEAIRIEHVNRRHTPGIKFENCLFSRKPGASPAHIARDWLDYSVRGALSLDVRDWAPLVLDSIKVIGGGSIAPLKIGVYGGRNVRVVNSVFAENAQMQISNASDVLISGCAFQGQGVKFSQDSRHVSILNSSFSKFGKLNYQGEERPVALTWSPRGVGDVQNITIADCIFEEFSGTSNRSSSYAAVHFARAIEAPYSITNFNLRNCDFGRLGTGQWAFTSHNNIWSINASNNWFGSVKGPTSCCNPGGAGATITEGAAFSPWCTDANCTATASGQASCASCLNAPAAPAVPSVSGLPEWVIIVIIVVVSVVVLAIGLTLIWCRMRTKQSPMSYMPLASYDPEGWQARLRSNPHTVEELIEQCNLKHIDFRRLHINPVCIGSGSFGSVFEAVLDPEPGPKGSSKRKSKKSEDHVAVKLLHPSAISTIEGFKQFLDEIKIQSLIDHPNVLTLRGLSIDPRTQQLVLITPLMDKGSLEDIVLKRKEPLSDSLKLKLASDIAYAMHYLHSKEPAIVHRDLKLSNVLVDKTWTCKVSDFGVAKALEKKAQTATIKGTPIYLSPESISVGRFSEKTDCFAYAITLWELWTGKRAYEDVDGSTANLLYRIAIDGLRPPIPDDCPPRLAALLRACFATDPDERPTFTEILEILSEMRFEADSAPSQSIN